MKNYFNSFLNLFARKKVEPEKPKIVPCDYIKHEDCVYWDVINQQCGIKQSDIDDLQTRYTFDDLDKFKKH